MKTAISNEIFYFLNLFIFEDLLILNTLIHIEALRKILNERDSPKVPTENIIQMADFVLKNNFFEFNGEVKRQKSGTAIGTKLAPPYAWMK